MAKCVINDCDRAQTARGMCRAHYERWLKHGDPLTGGPLRVENHQAENWLRDNASFDGEGCLIWPFRRDEQGRGRLSKSTIASRLMCELVHGPAGPDQQAAHSCGRGNDGCVNPKHLRWASPAENSEDKKHHGTHLLGERCPSAKLSDSAAAEILALRGSGRKQAEIAGAFGIHQSTVSDIWRGKRWSWMEAN